MSRWKRRQDPKPDTPEADVEPLAWFGAAEECSDRTLTHEVVASLRERLAMEPAWTSVEEVEAGIELAWWGFVAPLRVWVSWPRSTSYGTAVFVHAAMPGAELADPSVGFNLAWRWNIERATSYSWRFDAPQKLLSAGMTAFCLADGRPVPGVTTSAADLSALLLEMYSIGSVTAGNLWTDPQAAGHVQIPTDLPPNGQLRNEDLPEHLLMHAGRLFEAGQKDGNRWGVESAEALVDRYFESLPAGEAQLLRATRDLNRTIAEAMHIQAGSPYTAMVSPVPDLTVLLHATREDHPYLGPGLLVRCDTPYRVSEPEADLAVSVLTGQEMAGRSGTPLQGSWYVSENAQTRFPVAEDERALGFLTFLPSARADTLDAADHVGQLVRRARWLRLMCGPSQPPPAPPLQVN